MRKIDSVKIASHQAQKIFERQWKFESMLVTGVSSEGKVNATTAGRAEKKTKMGSAVDSKYQSGDRIIVLGSTVNDMPMGFGHAPWITG